MAETLLRAMSFNIRTSTARDLRFAWDLRKHLVIERIRAFDPDLLGLQECHDGEQAEFVREQLPDYEFLGVRRGDDSRTGREMAPVLFRREAFELQDHGHFWLSNTPQQPGSKLFGAVFPRTASWANLRLLSADLDPLYFFNTHFDYMPLIMSSSARILREEIWRLSSGAPTVLCGDFNTPVGGGTHRILSEPYDIPAKGGVQGERFALVDTEAQLRDGGDVAGTIHKFGRINRPIVIDWILASNHFTVLDSAVDNYNDNGLYPSDHYPVTATLSAGRSSSAAS